MSGRPPKTHQARTVPFPPGYAPSWLRTLMGRDRLDEHRVLTTSQITATHRLNKLHKLGVVQRFRTLPPGGGSYEWKYTLDQAGEEVAAAALGTTPPRAATTRGYHAA